MFNNKISWLLVFIASATSHAQQIDYKGFPEWSFGKRDSTEYYLYTPSNMKSGEKYPVVLFMHGCCGEDNHATLRNAVDPPVRVWHNFGANTQKIPTYILSPKTKRGWSQHIDNLKAVIDELIENHQGDPQRIYVSGFSMGGGGTWEFIERYPDYFAAALPMGMDFRGKYMEKFKSIPIWANRGENDWWSRHLGTQMASIRKLNGWELDSSNWVTGVNPRMTTFAGYGHGVMWPAVSTQNLVDWTYSKVNDGNKYPTVFFKSPSYKEIVKEGSSVKLDIHAVDPDGSIKKIDMFVNGKLLKSLGTAPYIASFKAIKGDNKIEAIAYDNNGKSTVGTTIVKVSIPTSITTRELKGAQQGAFYSEKLEAIGNGVLKFSTSNVQLPSGLMLSAEGVISGTPTRIGNFAISIKAEDEDGDVVEKTFTLRISKKSQDEVIVTNAKDYAGKSFPSTKIAVGVSPHNNRGDDEVTLSGGLDLYKGLTLIQTDANDTLNAKPFYMEFEVDEDVIVYVAYEKLDNLYTSTIPDWLKDFKKVEGDQIVAQYFYYDVYAKEFPKGKITLPDAEEKRNEVNTNYFVIVKKK